MAFEFRLPDVGEGIDGGEIVDWLVNVGATVNEDDPLVDIQTDKAIVQLPCPRTGTVLELRGQVGDIIPVGQVIAVIGDAPENSAVTSPVPVGTSPQDSRTLPLMHAEQGLETLPKQTSPRPTVPVGVPIGRPLASPAVRDAARKLGVDLTSVTGSGPGGRILREDLERVTPDGQPSAAPVEVQALQPAAREDKIVPLRGTRRVIARNMAQAWRSIPHIIDFREADTTALTSTRQALQVKAEAAGLTRLTMVPLLAKIASTVLRHHPSLNASLDEEREEITYHGEIHFSLAVSAPGGLVTPVIRDTDRKTVLQIAKELHTLTQAARDRRLTPAQLDGGTFTLNNYGALGSPQSTPIIRPGQAANLGLGRVTEKAVVRDGQIVARPMMGISCSGDHRIMDGDHLASFCNDLVLAIENPVLLLAELV
jgi:pyruvate dehydrogenase E2 component (dihydrolipoamide acetyltransferase)